MPGVTFDKEYLNRVLGVKIDDRALEDHVAKMGFEVEKIDSKSVYLNITPNRPDLLDAVGFARSLKNFMHKGSKYAYTREDQEPALEIEVGKKIKQMRPFISGFVALGVKLDEASLANLINFSEKFCESFGRQRRKIAMGMHNLDAIKPPLYYDLYGNERFIPLNQKKEYTFEKAVQELDQGKAYGETIKNGSEGYPALKDESGTISLIPIINSERTKLTKDTKNILVDITGTSEYIVSKSADLFASTFIDLGCKLKPVKVIYTKSKSVLAPEMKKEYKTISLAKLNSQLGVGLEFYNIISLANKMGYEAALLKNNIRFTLPAYRIDILNDQDIIEDVAIAYGYDYIQPLEIYSAHSGKLSAGTIASDKISNIMVGLGFSEAMNSYLTNEKTNFTDMRIAVDKDHVKLKNPKASSITIMRTWILPSLMKNLVASLDDKMPQNLFEIDNVFYIEEAKAIEAVHLGAVSAGSKANFNSMKAVFEELNTVFDLGYTIEKYKHESFVDGRCAKIVSKNKLIGFFGELHPEVLNNFGIEEPTVAMELELRRE